MFFDLTVLCFLISLEMRLVNKKLIQVAAGIIRNEFGQIYLTQRLEGQDFAQSLEFPGGKVNAGETPEQALRRELEEEIGIHILKG